MLGAVNDFAAILFVYEQSESGLSQIGCHANGANWILSLRPGRTYLFRVAAMSYAPGYDPQYLGHGGNMGLYIESSPFGVNRFKGTTDWNWGYWGDTTQGLIALISTSPDFFCGPAATDPVGWKSTTIRNGTIHTVGKGTAYAAVYRPPDFEAALNMEYCSLVAMTDWRVAEGMANWSWHDNNAAMTGGKSDVWGQRVTGQLTDLTGQCRSGTTGLQWHWILQCSKGTDVDSCEYSTPTLFGPKLTCDAAQ
jgi:hypothetical protein